MSLFITLAADALVAVLLVATIASCLRLSRRISGLKADEAAMRQTIGDLVVSTATAERAIKGLRGALDECDRTLAERLESGGRLCADLSLHVEAGEGVVSRLGAIVAQARGAPPTPREAEKTPREVGQAPREAVAVVQPLTKAVRAAEPAPTHAATNAATNGERLSATLAAAQALSERALDRIRARAA